MVYVLTDTSYNADVPRGACSVDRDSPLGQWIQLYIMKNELDMPCASPTP